MRSDLRGEMSKKCGENAKRKVFLLRLITEKWAISNKMPWSENPNLTRLFCNEVKWFDFYGGKRAVLRGWVSPEGHAVSRARGSSLCQEHPLLLL